MYSVIAPEPKFQAQLIYQAAVIMDVAGVNWTMPASVGWDNSDMAMFTGDNEIMGRIKRAHFETAARLKVKKIVMGECGHAFRSVYDMGNRWLGWSMPPITIVHAIEFYHDLIKGAHQDRQEVPPRSPCTTRATWCAAADCTRRPATWPTQMCENVSRCTPTASTITAVRRRRGDQQRPAL
jgi:hypothetical protein